MALAIRLLTVLIPLGISATASAQGIDFFDISLIDREELEILEAPEPPVIVREAELRLGPDSAPPSPDLTLARPLTRLGLDAEALHAIHVERNGSSPSAGHSIEFRMAGQWISMIAIETRVDPDFDAIDNLDLTGGGSFEEGRIVFSNPRNKNKPFALQVKLSEDGDNLPPGTYQLVVTDDTANTNGTSTYYFPTQTTYFKVK